VREDCQLNGITCDVPTRLHRCCHLLYWLVRLRLLLVLLLHLLLLLTAVDAHIALSSDGGGPPWFYKDGAAGTITAADKPMATRVIATQLVQMTLPVTVGSQPLCKHTDEPRSECIVSSADSCAGRGGGYTIFSASVQHLNPRANIVL
jgi:hypothetical protein